MAINIINERDKISGSFGQLQTDYIHSVEGIVEAYGTLVSALTQIQENNPTNATQIAGAALAKVGSLVEFTNAPEYALRQEDIDAQPKPVASPELTPPQPESHSAVGTLIAEGTVTPAPVPEPVLPPEQQQQPVPTPA